MSLIDRFRSGTEFDSVGHFTLDEQRAKAKMAHFQLTEPDDIFLLLIQSLVAAGARSIELEFDAENKLFLFKAQGSGLEQAKLQRLEEYLFDTSPKSVSYYLLEVVRNSISERGEVKLGQVGDDFRCEGPLTVDPTACHRKLKKKTRFSPIPIKVQQVALPWRELASDFTLELDYQEARYSELILVRHGVVVGEKVLESPQPFKAVSVNPLYSLDASFSDVVEDEIYAQTLQRIETELVRQFVEMSKSPELDTPEHALLLRRLDDPLPQAIKEALFASPLFPLADRERRVSLQELAPSSSVLVSQQRLSLQFDRLVLLLDRPMIREALQRNYSGRLQDATSEYRRLLEAEQNRQQWMANERPMELPPSAYLVERQLSGESWQAVMGILAPPGGESRIDMLVEGKLICSEALEGDLPPGTIVVINFTQVEINDMWTRPVGRSFRSAMRGLTAEIQKTFKSLELTQRDQLYPSLIEYIEDLFVSHSTLPEVALFAPLFPTLDGEWVNLETLRNWPRVALGLPGIVLERVPADVLPRPMLEYSAQTQKLLNARFLPVVDLRDAQRRLEELDRQLATPKKPELDHRWTFRKALEGLEGEVGLDPHKESSLVRVSLLHRGAELESFERKGTRTCAAEVVVNADGLKVLPDWSGFEAKEVGELWSELRRQIRIFEHSLLQREGLPPAAFLRLLGAYSKSISDFPDRKVFQTTTPHRRCSFNDLKKSMEDQGFLMDGAMGAILDPHPVLLREANLAFRNLLTKALGKIIWRRAEELIEANRLLNSFRSRPVRDDISFEGPVGFRYSLTQARGEVVIETTPFYSRSLVCYYGGRYVCRKAGQLPEGCAAAVDSEELELSADFNGATVPSHIQKEIDELAERGLLECAQAERLKTRELAYRYLLDHSPSVEFIQSFEELPLIPIAGDKPWSIQRLRSSGNCRGFVTPLFSLPVQSENPVVVAHPHIREILKRLCGLTLLSIEAQLQQEHDDRLYLNSLPLTLTEHSLFRRSFKGETLQADLGLSGESSELVGLDDAGAPLGYLPSPSVLSVIGTVRGAVTGKRDQGLRPTAQLKKPQLKLLKGWVEALYLDWVLSINSRALESQERALAIKALDKTKHQLSSSSDNHTSLARALWSLPLFPRADRSWVSGETLAQQLQLEEQPILFGNDGLRTPGSVLDIESGGQELAILTAVLGQAVVRRFEAPPLLDTSKISTQLEKLYRWGVTLGATPKSEAPTRKKAKKKIKKGLESELSPEAAFLSVMRTELRELLGGHYHKIASHARTCVTGSWVFGPPIYLRREGDQTHYFFNLSHKSIRWIISGMTARGTEATKDLRTSLKLSRMLVLIHWISLLNKESEQLTDQHEKDTLLSLAKHFCQILPDKNSNLPTGAGQELQ